MSAKSNTNQLKSKWRLSNKTVKTSDGYMLSEFVVNEKGEPICGLCWDNNPKSGVKGKDAMANAKLIATAPEMLKTLNAVKSAVFNHGQNIQKNRSCRIVSQDF